MLREYFEIAFFRKQNFKSQEKYIKLKVINSNQNVDL